MSIEKHIAIEKMFLKDTGNHASSPNGGYSIDYVWWLEDKVVELEEKQYLDIYSAIAHGLAGCQDVDKEDVDTATKNVIRTINKR